MVWYNDQRREVFVDVNHFGTSVCLFHDFLFRGMPAIGMRDSEQGNQHSWRALAFPSCSLFERMQLLPSCADVTEALSQIRYRLPVLFRNPGSVTGKCHGCVAHEFYLLGQSSVCIRNFQNPNAAFLKLWSADHKWSSGSALVVLLDWTLVKKRQKK